MEQNQTTFNQPAAAEQPSIIPPVSQPAKMPEPIALLKESLNVYKEHFSSLISISLLFLVGTFFVLIIPGFGYSLIFLFILAFGLNLFVNLFIPLALMVVLRSLMAGESVQAGDSLKSALGLILSAIVIHILSVLIIIGASIPLLIPGMIVGILLYFSLFSLVFEGQYGFNALMRSCHLVKGNVAAVFSRLFVVGLAISTPIVFFSLISGIVQLPETTQRIVIGFYTVLFVPLSIVYSYLLFRFLARQRPLESFNPLEKRGFYKGLMVWGGVAIVALTIAGFLLLRSVFPSSPFSFFKDAEETSLSKADTLKKNLIMANFVYTQIQAKTYFDNNNSSYIGVDDWDRHPEAKRLVEDVAANGGQVRWGMITSQSYVVWTPLISNPGTFYCVDSTGDVCELDHEPEGGERVALQCGCPALINQLPDQEERKEDDADIDIIELLKRSRDSQRISDLSTLRSLIGLYETSVSDIETEFLKICQKGKIYFSNKGTTAVDGAGWLPIDFNKISGGSPVSELPMDPQNIPPYTYWFACDAENLTFELSANFESDHYMPWETDDGGNNDKVYEVGADLKIIH